MSKANLNLCNLFTLSRVLPSRPSHGAKRPRKFASFLGFRKVCKLLSLFLVLMFGLADFEGMRGGK